MKTEYMKFKKKDFLENSFVTNTIQIKITEKKGLKKFIELTSELKKSDYLIMSKIKILGKGSEGLVIKTDDMKFKEYKGLMKEADYKNVDSIVVTFVDDIMADLSDKDIIRLAKIFKDMCKTYDAKYRRVIY